MELSDFIEQTLTQITEGVRRSQDSIREKGGYANPAAYLSSEDKAGAAQYGRTATGQDVLLVDFDVAVSVSGEIGQTAGGKLAIASVFGAGAEASNKEINQSTSRIKFKVPLALPIDGRSKQEYDQRNKNEQAKIDSMYRR